MHVTLDPKITLVQLETFIRKPTECGLAGTYLMLDSGAFLQFCPGSHISGTFNSKETDTLLFLSATLHNPFFGNAEL